MNSLKINKEIELIKEKYEKILEVEIKKIESCLFEKMENKFNQFEKNLQKNK